MVITDGKLAFLFQKNLMVGQLDDKGDSEQLDDKGYSLEDKRDPCPELCCHGGRRRGLLTESNHPLVPVRSFSTVDECQGAHECLTIRVTFFCRILEGQCCVWRIHASENERLL